VQIIHSNFLSRLMPKKITVFISLSALFPCVWRLAYSLSACVFGTRLEPVLTNWKKKNPKKSDKISRRFPKSESFTWKVAHTKFRLAVQKKSHFFFVPRWSKHSKKLSHKTEYDRWLEEKKKRADQSALNLSSKKRKSDHSLLASFCTKFLRVVLFSESGEKNQSIGDTRRGNIKNQWIQSSFENQVKKKWKFEVGFSGVPDRKTCAMYQEKWFF
jgi:hypothetical protein